MVGLGGHRTNAQLRDDRHEAALLRRVVVTDAHLDGHRVGGRVVELLVVYRFEEATFENPLLDHFIVAAVQRFDEHLELVVRTSRSSCLLEEVHLLLNLVANETRNGVRDIVTNSQVNSRPLCLTTVVTDGVVRVNWLRRHRHVRTRDAHDLLSQFQTAVNGTETENANAELLLGFGLE